MTYWATQVVQVVKNCLPVQETEEMWIQSLGQKDPLEEEMTTYSSTLAWRIPWTKEPGGLQSMGSQRVRHRHDRLSKQRNRSASVITYYFTTSGKLLSSSNWASHIWRAIEIVIIVSISLDYCKNWVIFHKDLIPRDLHVAIMFIIVIVICVLQETLILLKVFGI